MADDDPDDRELTADALREAHLANELRTVEDGIELLAYLRHTGPYADPATAPRPGIILLDLNMPRMDGREALAVIKADPELRQIPVIVMTTSDAEVDIKHAYAVGANSYVTKPVTFTELVARVQELGRYWLEIVELPLAKEAAA